MPDKFLPEKEFIEYHNDVIFQGTWNKVSVYRHEGKGMSKGEFNSVAQVNGGLDNMINWDGKDRDLLALIKYIADEDKLDKVLENPQIIKTPVVRNGRQSTIGYRPDVWKTWK